jgi:hypothetical protein
MRRRAVVEEAARLAGATAAGEERTTGRPGAAVTSAWRHAAAGICRGRAQVRARARVGGEASGDAGARPASLLGREVERAAR